MCCLALFSLLFVCIFLLSYLCAVFNLVICIGVVLHDLEVHIGETKYCILTTTVYFRIWNPVSTTNTWSLYLICA